MKISYRKLTPAESKLYREIRLECLKVHPENFGSTFEEQSMLPKLRFEKAIERAVEGRFVIGAFDQQNLIGIGGCILSVPGDDALPKAGTIIQMYVRSTYNGRKIGLNLIRAVLGDAFKSDGVEQIVLEVKEGNMPAIRVYEQAGFQAYTLAEEETAVQNDGSRHMILRRDDWSGRSTA